MSKRYNLPDHKSGYRFEGLELKFEDDNQQPIPVTGEIRMVFKHKTIPGIEHTLSTPDKGITILTPDTWRAQIDQQIINWVPGIYSYELLVFETIEEAVQYMHGQWSILKSVAFN